MDRRLVRTPTEAEILNGIAAGKHERSAFIRSLIVSFTEAVRKHFVFRAAAKQAALRARCAGCAC